MSGRTSIGPFRFYTLRAKTDMLALAHNKSLQRSGGRCHLVCVAVVVLDKLPVISLGEPPGAELSRYATSLHIGKDQEHVVHCSSLNGFSAVLGSVPVVRGAPPTLLPTSSATSCRTMGPRLAWVAGAEGLSAFIEHGSR